MDFDPKEADYMIMIIIIIHGAIPFGLFQSVRLIAYDYLHVSYNPLDLSQAGSYHAVTPRAHRETRRMLHLRHFHLEPTH